MTVHSLAARLAGILASLLIFCGGLSALGAETLRSPDGKVIVTFELKEGRPFWDVAYSGNRFIQRGLLGVETALENFCGTYKVVGMETAARDTTWKAVWGNLSEIRDHFNQLAVKLQETAGKQRVLHVVLRAYNEGVGCRYEFPPQPGLAEVTVKKRLTEYRFAQNFAVYQNRNYEYGTVKIDTMSRSEGAVTLDVGGGNFVSLTDADRSNFSMVFWSNRKGDPNTIVGGLAGPASGALPFATSWEVIIVGETLGKLYENRFIVENLNPPCAIADTSWINPGPAICQIRNSRMVTAELKKLLDFASAHNIPYMEIDHSWNGAETKWTPQEIEFFEKNKLPFWNDKPEWRSNIGGNPMVPAKGWVPFRPQATSGGNFVDLNIPELTAYGKSLKPPVGVCVYVRSVLLKEFGGEHPIDTVFAAYEKMGLAGVKPGFTPSASQYNEQMVAYMVKKAAEHKLILTIHDGYYPYGLSRTYPNLVNVEGGAGDEAEHSIKPEMKSLHDVMLVFTRFLMGPFDYTPEIGRKSKTHCHQVAMIGVYHGRPSIRGGMPQWSPGGEGGGEIEFIEKWPGIFDEMKVTAEVCESVTVARRRAGNWYVASMSGPHARSYPYPLDFLTPGKTYQASIYSDTPGSRKSTHTQQKVTSQTVIPIAMEPNGGHLMILTLQGQTP
jgi:alpha-glucosidase